MSAMAKLALLVEKHGVAVQKYKENSTDEIWDEIIHLNEEIVFYEEFIKKYNLRRRPVRDSKKITK